MPITEANQKILSNKIWSSSNTIHDMMLIWSYKEYR